MDPYVLTILKQAVMIGAAVGGAIALAYGLVQYSRLHYAMTLNMTPGQLP